MRIEKEGFVLHLEGTWCEISNKYAVLESGDVAVNEEDIPAGTLSQEEIEAQIQQGLLTEIDENEEGSEIYYGAGN